MVVPLCPIVYALRTLAVRVVMDMSLIVLVRTMLFYCGKIIFARVDECDGHFKLFFRNLNFDLVSFFVSLIYYY
jgi:hypothetical protein